MQQHEKDAVRELIEALIVELGVDAVPAELDVDGVLTLLQATEPEAPDASEEEIPAVTVEGTAEEVV